MIPFAQLLRGALVIVDPVSGAETKTISFQFNPASFTRSLTPQTDYNTKSSPNARRDATRYTGVPKESFSVVIEMDGSGQLPGYQSSTGTVVGSGDTMVRDYGLSPQIAALEVLIGPSSQWIDDENKALDNGTLEVALPLAPLVLFSWGKKRLIPVNIDSMEVAELAFDQNLNPTQAKITLKMSVVTSSEITPQHKGYKYYVQYQKWKESGAQLAASWRYR